MKSARACDAARRAVGVAILSGACLLAACGGGGGGGGGAALPLPVAAAPAPPAESSEPIVAASSVQGQCAAPRFGVDPDTGAAFPDRAGSLDTEKSWVRAWVDETYLWFDQVPTTLAARDYATPQAYFAVLKTPATTATGRPRDRFHFTQDTAAYRASAQSGIEVGYGLELAFLSAAPPRDVRVAFAEPGSPAAAAGIERGTRLVEVDGIEVANGADVAALNAALAPAREGESHGFRLQAPDGSLRSVTLTSQRITRQPVQNVKTIASASGPVGYLLFNDHMANAEAPLVAAIQQLKAAAVVDLVIDMRYNGGGLLDIASELAFMVAAPAATGGTTFERLQFNARNPFGLTPAQTTLPFHATSRGFSVPAGQPLPQLGLSRVTVLAGPDTCSASESVINGLRGVGVAVNLVGGTTCGKPYGFFPQDNCGTTYFAIQFQGVNQQGFGDYGDGFAPTCAVADDFGHALGDPAEARLAAALAYRNTGSCPAAPAAKASAALVKAEAEGVPYLVRSPLRENRIVALP
ncbi:S41 family peptidase [Variovorax sp. J22P168]|uniref:S41 family peptidase n=1 Tax=Variovorax jilinensis TaxID=3053513 RepID=UPI0025780134|nr:S41 family peptidase [Variovorax sp. J22P168]MDM0014349.1 S41 family peptidase [Variovorax sp. J22P168]